jgi:general secretion pathway protein H
MIRRHAGADVKQNSLLIPPRSMGVARNEKIADLLSGITPTQTLLHRGPSRGRAFAARKIRRVRFNLVGYRPNRSEAGFTMIEMMVVLAIMAMAMAIAPAIVSGLSGGRLRAASDGLAAELRGARGQALRRNTPVELTLDLTKRGYSLSGSNRFRPLPDVVDAVDVGPAALVQPGGIARIRFLPDGTADQARISLRHGTMTKVIAVDWLTGRVRADD